MEEIPTPEFVVEPFHESSLSSQPHLEPVYDAFGTVDSALAVWGRLA